MGRGDHADFRCGLDDIIANVRSEPKVEKSPKKTPKMCSTPMRDRPIMKPPGALEPDFLFDPSTTIHDIWTNR